AGAPARVPESLKYEVEVARSGPTSMSTMDRIGRRSVLACPDCNGVMWEIDEGDVVRYRCHVGHAYTSDLMSLALDESLRPAPASAAPAPDERMAPPPPPPPQPPQSPPPPPPPSSPPPP